MTSTSTHHMFNLFAQILMMFVQNEGPTLDQDQSSSAGTSPVGQDFPTVDDGSFSPAGGSELNDEGTYAHGSRLSALEKALRLSSCKIQIMRSESGLAFTIALSCRKRGGLHDERCTCRLSRQSGGGAAGQEPRTQRRSVHFENHAHVLQMHCMHLGFLLWQDLQFLKLKWFSCLWGRWKASLRWFLLQSWTNSHLSGGDDLGEKEPKYVKSPFCR
jgi:hypothetical protein